MDAKKKKALVDELADQKKKNFVFGYGKENREWFIDKLVRVYESRGLSDAQIDQNVRKVVTGSKDIVRARRKLPKIGLKETNAQKKLGESRRVEIVYGAIAHHPEFIEPSNSNLLDFILKRRYRSIFRMDCFVNPKARGIFYYPEDCAKDHKWQVNKDAQAFWEPVFPDRDVPIRLKAPSGGGAVDPVAAINSLFIPHKKICETNLLKCDPVMTIVMMDSLQEASNPGKLLKQIADRQADFLVIYHPNLADHPHFIVDASPEALFTHVHQAVEDIQVGDHIYVFNHPLYKIFRPRGSWTGEHCLLYRCGDRSVRSKAGFYFGGHGKEGTVFHFYNAFLKELQSYLHRSFAIGKIFLTYKLSNDTSIPASKVTTQDTQIGMDDGTTLPLRLYQFDVSFKYTNYEKTVRDVNEKGFVIIHFTDRREFCIQRQKTIAELLATPTSRLWVGTIPFRRKQSPADPAELFHPEFWSIYYTTHTNTTTDYKPFVRRGSAIAFKRLTIDELFENPFGKLDIFASGVAMTLPKVDLGAAYKAFLVNSGAI